MKAQNRLELKKKELTIEDMENTKMNNTPKNGQI